MVRTGLAGMSFTGNNGGLFFYGQIGRADARPSHGGGEPSQGTTAHTEVRPPRRFPTGTLAERALGPPAGTTAHAEVRPPGHFHTGTTAHTEVRPPRRFHMGTLAERTLGPPAGTAALFSWSSSLSRISRCAGKFALPCALSPAIRQADKGICTRGAESRRTAPVTRLPARARK